MSKFIELPVFIPKIKTAEYMYMPVNIEQIVYIMSLSKDKCELFLSSGESIIVDIDIYEMKEIINCTEKVDSPNDI